MRDFLFYILAEQPFQLPQMEHRIETLQEKTLIGNHLLMSFADNKTKTLWQTFMPQRNKISKIRGTSLYSVEVYPPGFFNSFDPSRLFEKWAAIEADPRAGFPPDMDILVLPVGSYAVFIYRGLARQAAPVYEKIFRQ